MTWLYGITSKIPNFSPFHYLLADFDGIDITSFFCALQEMQKFCPTSQFLGYKTRHGFHAIFFHTFTFEKLTEIMPRIPFLDLKWYNIGVRRGYWFLIQPTIFFFPRPVQYAKIKAVGESEWLNTRLQTT